LAIEKFFSKIDLTHVYQQMKLKEESRQLVTINTHQGLFRYTHLPFEVASAPSIFQKVMDMQGLPKVICYLDDILVSGSTKEEDLQNLVCYNACNSTILGQKGLSVPLCVMLLNT